MNYKRRKSKRSIRCTMCTMYRWFGNNKGRSKTELSNHRDRQKRIKAMKDEAYGKGDV